MEVRFEDARLDRLEVDPSFDGGFSQAVVRAFRKAMQAIRAAPDERTFYQARGLRFEKLKAAHAGNYSMRLNDQWRLILKFENVDSGKIVVVIAVEDYH